jgi:hypothetical protein
MAETSYDQKPYAFVPFVNRVERKKIDEKSNDLRKSLSSSFLCGQLRVTLNAMTPLHFGTGAFDENLVNKLLREQEKIVLPGSGFKGVFRSAFEAVTESCILNYPRALEKMKPKGQNGSCGRNNGLCPACSVFGCFGHRGKLGFSSFVAENGETELLRLPSLQTPFREYPRRGQRFAVERGEGNERLYYGNFNDTHGLDVARLSKAEFFRKKEQEQDKELHKEFYGRKFYKHSKKFSAISKDAAGGDQYECLAVGSKLVGTITYQGLTDDEFGALLFALGLGWESPIYHKIGYAKPAYLGSVSLQVEPLRPPERYQWKNHTPDELTTKAKSYYAAHQDSIGPAVNALQELWSEISETECWTRNPETKRLGY